MASIDTIKRGVTLRRWVWASLRLGVGLPFFA